MGKGGKTSDQAQGCRLALDLDSTAVTLFVRSDLDVWSRVGQAELGADDFSEQIDSLRVEALVRSGEQETVLLWLPPEQVITRSMTLAPGSEDAARTEATHRIAEDTDFEPSELTIAMAEGDNPKETTVMGALLQTVHEAQDYGARWGFPKTLVSTRTDEKRFGANGPIFAPPPTIAHQAGHAARRLAAAAALLFVVGGAIYGGYAALQPLLEEPTDIRSSGPALASFAVVLDPITPEGSPINQVRVGGVGSLAIQRLLVPDTDRLNSYGTPLHKGPLRSETPVVLAAPGEGAPMQVGGAPIQPTYQRPGRLTGVVAITPPPDASAVRLALQRIRLAGPPRQDGTAYSSAPSFKRAKPSDDADRIASLAPLDKTVPVEPGTGVEADLPAESEKNPDADATGEVDVDQPSEPESSPQAPAEMAQQPEPKPKNFEAIVAAVFPEKEVQDPQADSAEDAAALTSASNAVASLVPSATPLEQPGNADPEPSIDPDAPTVFAALQAPAPSKRPKVFERAAKRPVSTQTSVAAVTIPRTVRSAARKVGLSLDETSLIGVIDARNGRKALVRMPSGDYRKVAKGDDLDGWRVNSISREAMRLTRRGQNRTLLLVSR